MSDTPDTAVASALALDAGRLKTADELATVLRAMQAETPVDLRGVFDLMAIRADRLIDEERFEDALKANVDLAGFAQAHRDILLEDPAPYFFVATNLALKLQKVGLALGLLGKLAAEQREGGMGPQWLAETKSWITRLQVQASGTRPVARDGEVVIADADPMPEDPGSRDYTAVDVYYATDRARTGHSYPSRFYGSGRGELELGIASVSIPKSHTPGAVDAPSVFRLEFSVNPVRHVVLQSVTPMEGEDFFARLAEDADSRLRSEIFVYVHGFNVSFEKALKRAAQIAYDINYQGVPVVYSWPSRARATGYFPDSAVVRLSARRLCAFLEQLAVRKSAKRIHLIAHSMGSRAVSDALELLCLRRRAEGAPTRILDQLLFAAPDVDADLFREMLPNIRATANRVTLYGSERDWALSASRYIHGDVPRAGQGGDDMIVFDDLDSIDMSAAGDDMLAHSYYARSKSALLDIATLVWQNLDPGLRYGLIPQTGRHGDSWRFLPDDDRMPAIVRLCTALQALNVVAAEDAIKLVRSLGVSDEDARDIEAFVAGLFA